jgi:preprotein translocase subunit SecE
MQFSPIVFLKEVKIELSKVSWPDRQQAFRLTLIVIVISVIVAAFIGGLDFFFVKLMEVIIR